MRIRISQVVLSGIVAAPLQPAENLASILQQQAIELLRAVDTGSSTVWDDYLHSNAVIADKNLAVSSKPLMVGQIRPFPPVISGRLTVPFFGFVTNGTASSGASGFPSGSTHYTVS